MENKFVLRVEFEELRRPEFHHVNYEDFNSYEQLQDRKEQIRRWAYEQVQVVKLETYEQL